MATALSSRTQKKSEKVLFDGAMKYALKNENKTVPDFTGLFEQIIEQRWSGFRPLKGIWA